MTLSLTSSSFVVDVVDVIADVVYVVVVDVGVDAVVVIDVVVGVYYKRVNQKPDGVQKTRREHGGNMAAHDGHMQRHEGI